jgi:hypothetical protein
MSEILTHYVLLPIRSLNILRGWDKILYTFEFFLPGKNNGIQDLDGKLILFHPLKLGLMSK